MENDQGHPTIFIQGFFAARPDASIQDQFEFQDALSAMLNSSALPAESWEQSGGGSFFAADIPHRDMSFDVDSQFADDFISTAKILAGLLDWDATFDSYPATEDEAS